MSPREIPFMWWVIGFIILNSLAPAIPGILQMGIFFALLWVVVGRMANNQGSRSRRVRVEQRINQADKESGVSHKHARAAMAQVGFNPEPTQTYLLDIGVLTYLGDEKPSVVRDWNVSQTVNYLQPFIQLNLMFNTVSTVRFEILNAVDDRIYVFEDRYQLKQGKNLVVAKTRLPIKPDQASDGFWQMNVYLGDMVIANHLIGWTTDDPDTALIQGNISTDGELNPDLATLLKQPNRTPLSLDELLADQDRASDDHENQPRRNRR